MDSLYLLVALGAVLAAFVQGLSGFGFGLVAMTFWSWTLDPILAVVLVVYGSLQGQIINAYTVRPPFKLSFLWPYLLGAVAGIPLGVWLVPHLDIVWLKTFLGTLLLFWCPLMLLNSKLPAFTGGGRRADTAVGFVGGVLGGIGGFTGPANALWTQLRGYSKDSSRALIQHFNLAVLFATFVSYIATGIITKPMLPIIAMMAPVLLIPNIVGSRLYIGISELRFRQVILCLLTGSGLIMLATSVPALLSR